MRATYEPCNSSTPPSSIENFIKEYGGFNRGENLSQKQKGEQTVKRKRIVVCGPAHSGKSVFVQQLRRLLLALGIVGVIEGCPDGEGGWAGATEQGLVGALRHKGKFTDEFVSWVVQSVKGAKMPITLIDVGGVRSPENERIFEAADAFIVLANPTKVGEMEAWEAFGRAHGCKPVALLESVLGGESSLAPDQADGVLRGVQAGLERGKRVGGPVMEALVSRLLQEVGCEALPGETEATVHTGRLADALGIPAEARGARLGFRSEHAARIPEVSKEALAGQEVQLWGACPAWVAAQVAAQATGLVRLWDIRLGWVELPELRIAATPSENLTWKVEKHGGNTIVSFAIPGGVLDVKQLSAITVPAVGEAERVVLSGRGPHWLVAAVARAYARAGHALAVIALHESAETQADGRSWGEVHQGFAPAVVVRGEGLGQLIAVPTSAVK